MGNIFQDINVINHAQSTEEQISSNQFEKRKDVKLLSLKNIIRENDFKSLESEALTIKKKHNKQIEDRDLIDNCIIKHFFMRTLDAPARLEIIKEMSLAYVPEKTIIFKQGSPGNYFYILKSGKANLIIDNVKKITFNVGESFGELALLHGSPRTGTVIAETECYLWVLERKHFRKIVDHIAKLNFEENKNFIQSIPILAHIDHYQQTILCVSLIKETFDEGTFIVKEGDAANCIYIVKSGEVNCIRDGKIIRTLKNGENFGERSILIDSKRTMDCVAKTNCICYSISKVTLQNMLGEKYITLLYLNFVKASFYTSKKLNHINENIIENIFEFFEAINLTGDKIAFEKGYKKSSNFVIIIDGNLINNDTKEIIANRGSILFEDDLFENSNEIINYELVPSPDCLFLKADTEKILNKLGGNLKDIIKKSEMIKTLKKVSLFRNLPMSKYEKLTKKIGIENYEKGKKIISEGETGDKFYIVKKGNVDISVNGKYLRTLNEKEYFGERALFFNEPRSATITAKTDVELYYLCQNDFKSNIEENMKQHLINRLYLQDNKIELKDLIFVQSLGSGNYGNVSSVSSKKNNFEYAIKGISRNQIDAEQLHHNLELEKSILLQIDHPFIVKLVKTLKDERFIYFLMELVKGKELFDVIRDIGLLNKEQTQFYGGCMLIAIEYLHERKFIYRDLKPENIMVTYDTGYIKIIDFGTSKKIIDRTSTIIGTPHYMAPEVILGEGYSFQVDCWSIAICLYEFMCGGLPFGETAEDPMDVYLAIVNAKLSFPKFCKDRDFKNLMIQMLSKNPIKRLTKIKQIKNHVWFQNINWDELISMNMVPPYIPKQKISNTKDDYKGMEFIEYVKNHYKDYENNEIEITNEEKEKYNKWFENY